MSCSLAAAALWINRHAIDEGRAETKSMHLCTLRQAQDRLSDSTWPPGHLYARRQVLDCDYRQHQAFGGSECLGLLGCTSDTDMWVGPKRLSLFSALLTRTPDGSVTALGVHDSTEWNWPCKSVRNRGS
ncbi:hypothetical protein OBBRIDRAFT_821721 [Obba rivulosa]|uniref:Uncharacterized protein n=1 Tax=Obba rivulosa TaxID=1052685 RepID=A0A8E2AMD8_9APHY|nr:hypothetical protein OBBRIDRAFT_821721 [Obba rivulosa]